MLPYFILIIIIISSYFFMKRFIKNYRKKYCIFIGILLFLMLALRDTSVGLDIEGLYLPYFKLIKSMSLREIVAFCNEKETELVFYLLNYIIAIFSENVHFYLAIMAFPYVFIVSRFIYKYAKNPVIGFLIFLSLNYYCFSFSALRHTLAASILVFSYDFLKEKKLLPFLISVFIASTFHRTALIFLIAYPISNLKIGWKQIAVVMSIVLCTTLFRDVLFNLIFLVFNSGHFYEYLSRGKSMSLVFFAINFSLYLFMLYLFGEDRNKKSNALFLNLQFLCMCFSAMTLILGEMIRISFYFGIFACASVPNAIENSNYSVNKKFYYFLMSLCLIVYFLNFTIYNNSIVPYSSIFS
mgnify:CR=1 FL=1